MACSNLTNLALTRALARARDAAVRSALGASRGRLLRQAIIDHGVLALAGGALAMWIADAVLRVFVLTAPVDLPRLEDVTDEEFDATFKTNIYAYFRLSRAALRHMKPGGAIVYSTCSIEPDENQGVVKAVLHGMRGLKLEAEHESTPGRPSDGGYWARLRKS